MPKNRLDRNGSHQYQFKINKKKIFSTQSVCGICGMPVDFEFKYPHPLSPCIDHIIPLAKGGHPSALENLQLAHLACNNEKKDKIMQKIKYEKVKINNRDLPQSMDWTKYRSEENE